MPDMLMSKRTASTRRLSTSSSASSPFEHSRISKPSLRNVLCSARRSLGSSSTMRTVPCDVVIRVLSRRRQGEREDRSTIVALDPHAPMVSLDNSLYNRESKPGADWTGLDLRSPVESLKNTLPVARRDHSALVPHGHCDLLIGGPNIHV